MKKMVFKLSAQGNKRILFTVVGIAVCIMYLTGTIGMVEGLNAGTTQLSSRVKQGPLLVYKNSLNESFIPFSTTNELSGEFTPYRIVEVQVSANSTSILKTYALSSDNLTEQLGETSQNVFLGKGIIDFANNLNISLNIDDNLTLEAHEGSTNSSFNATYITLALESLLFPNDWIIASEETILTLKSPLEGGYSFLVVPQNNTADLQYLKSKGYDTVQTASFLTFFERGIFQIEEDLWGIIATSALVITILVYSIMSIEVQYKIEDIRILRYLGGSRKLVMAVFILKAFFISLLGGVLGVAMGVVAMNAITSFSPLIGFNTLVIPQASWQSVALPFFVALLFGLIGGLLPAYNASKLSIKRGDSVAA
jgi:hypothetical protein